MLRILNEVGMRIQGAGPHTDSLRLLVEHPTEDSDGGLKLTLSYYNLHVLRGLAKVADGLNELEGTVGAVVQQGWTKYERIPLAESVVEMLTEFVNS